MFLATQVPLGSVWAILPKTRPHVLLMPSMAAREPLGLMAISMEGTPSASQYWVAIWPAAARAAMTSSEAWNFPSPWETGTRWMSPMVEVASHGESVLTTFVRA